MTVKPQFQFLIIVGAMLFAALLSYGILNHVKPTDTPDAEAGVKDVPAMETGAAQPPLPGMTFYDAADKEVTLADFKGDVLLVNLWASWCTPCVVELPALEKLQGKLKSRGFKVVAISVDRDPPGKIREFLEKRGIESLDFYYDRDREVPRKWTYQGIPTSFLIDRQGNVVQKFDGPYDWDKGEMFDHIRKLTQ